MPINWHPTYSASWRNPKIKALSALGKLTFRYLHANAYTTYSGIYYLSQKEMADDLDLNQNQLPPLIASVALVHLEVKRKTPLICYDPGSSVVWVVGQWKQAISHSPNHIAGIGNEFLRTTSLPFWYEFFRKYKPVLKTLRNPRRYKRADDLSFLIDDLKPRPTNAWPPTWTFGIGVGNKKPLTSAEMSKLWAEIGAAEYHGKPLFPVVTKDLEGSPSDKGLNGEKTVDQAAKIDAAAKKGSEAGKRLQNQLNRDAVKARTLQTIANQVKGPETPWPKSVEEHIQQTDKKTLGLDLTSSPSGRSAVSEQNIVLSDPAKTDFSVFDMPPAVASNGAAGGDLSIGKIPVHVVEGIPDDEIAIITPPDDQGESRAVVVQNVGVGERATDGEGGSVSGDSDPPPDPWGKIVDAQTGEVTDNPKIDDTVAREASDNLETVAESPNRTDRADLSSTDAGDADASPGEYMPDKAEAEPAFVLSEPAFDADIDQLRVFQRKLIAAKIDGSISEWTFRHQVKKTADRMTELEGKPN
jgi:hypothetical protein